MENNIQIKIDEQSVIDLYHNSGTDLSLEEFIKQITWRNEVVDGVYIFYAESLR